MADAVFFPAFPANIEVNGICGLTFADEDESNHRYTDQDENHDVLHLALPPLTVTKKKVRR